MVGCWRVSKEKQWFQNVQRLLLKNHLLGGDCILTCWVLCKGSNCWLSPPTNLLGSTRTRWLQWPLKYNTAPGHDMPTFKNSPVSKLLRRRFLKNTYVVSQLWERIWWLSSVVKWIVLPSIHHLFTSIALPATNKSLHWKWMVFFSSDEQIASFLREGKPTCRQWGELLPIPPTCKLAVPKDWARKLPTKHLEKKTQNPSSMGFTWCSFRAPEKQNMIMSCFFMQYD